jgi:8-oxo-dGTP pyrophosphatase MutT (NUDIX family)
MIQKRNTYAYVEFILGKYKKHDTARIMNYFNSMTNYEKLDIWSMDFSLMWFRIWSVSPESLTVSDDQQLSQSKFHYYLSCKNYFKSNFAADIPRLRHMLSNSYSTETLWELPKGRLSGPQEPPLSCALREFSEETGISTAEFRIVDGPYLSCTHNGITRYQNHYYLAIINGDSKYNNDKELRLNYNKQSQISEVVGMRWMDITQISLADPEMHYAKTIRHMFTVLRKKYKIRAPTTHCE